MRRGSENGWLGPPEGEVRGRPDDNDQAAWRRALRPAVSRGGRAGHAAVLAPAEGVVTECSSSPVTNHLVLLNHPRFCALMPAGGDAHHSGLWGSTAWAWKIWPYYPAGFCLPTGFVLTAFLPLPL